jgi:Fe-S cluster assembly protein SufD
MMAAAAEKTGAWLAEFSKLRTEEPWLKELRNRALARFRELGFPTTHDEEWRFTNVAPIARTNFEYQPSDRLVIYADPVSELKLPEASAHLGRYAGFDKNPFTALNTAFLTDATILRVPEGAVVEKPIEITYNVPGAANGAAVHPRALILIGAQAQCTIVETFLGSGSYLTNAVTEIVAGEGAAVDYYRLQMESERGFHIAAIAADLGRGSMFRSHTVSFGAALARTEINAVLSEGSECTLNGLYVVGGSQHVDTRTTIDHAQPHGASHELYKGILDGQSSAVFNGRIIVRPDAQKTDAKQTNKNLVLSEGSTLNTKPELQIYADDVRCTHGATIGQLDEEAVFYLRSRGIGREQTREILISAFARQIIDGIKVDSLRNHIEGILAARLARPAQ